MKEIYIKIFPVVVHRNKRVTEGYPKHWGETVLNCKNVAGVTNVKH